MIKVTRSADIAATPDEVATFVAELPHWPTWFALWKGWSGDVPTEAEVGAKFKHKVRVLGVTGDVTWEVVDLDIPRRFHLKGKGPSRSTMDVDFHIKPRKGGSTVSFEAQIGGLALKPFERTLQPWIEARADRTLAALTDVLAER